MDVWIVNPFDNLPLEGNRPQRYWLMAQAFVRAGHRVTLWTSDFSHATKKKRVPGASGLVPRADGVMEVEGIEVRMIPTLPYPTNVCLARIRSHRQLARDFERLARQRLSENKTSADHLQPSPSPYLIIASTPPLGLCLAAMRVARSCGARFVCDIQDAWPETFERLLPCGFKRMGKPLFVSMYQTAWKIYREADFVTGVCSRYAELSGREDFYLAYLGIEESEEVRVKSEEAGSKSRLVYIGNLGVGYDLETVIEAVAKRSELTLDIAGKGPAEKRLKFKVESLKLGGRVRFHGYLGADAMAGLMMRCNVGVIPMRDDSWVGLPNKLGDYLKAGLHVVSSLHGECGELLARTGFGRTYTWASSDSFLAAVDALPHVPVSLPDELRAERIYPKYVERIARL